MENTIPTNEKEFSINSLSHEITEVGIVSIGTLGNGHKYIEDGYAPTNWRFNFGLGESRSDVELHIKTKDSFLELRVKK